MVPLATADFAGAESRKILGTVVIVGMLAATGIAIFIIPALFVLVTAIARDGTLEFSYGPNAAGDAERVPAETVASDT